ncbi:MAG: transglutaminase family protein [Microcella sp.]|uniref:transglutaminase-like domain-containing protein n=1 Tax=Microcella sp. TaxID=1913979 RepID=UPI003314F67E
MTIPVSGPDRRAVGCSLSASVGEPTSIVLAVAVARSAGVRVDESLAVTVDGRPVEVRELEGRAGTRWHRAIVPTGELEVRYEAEVEGRAAPATVEDRDLVEDVRPSRYVQSDLLPGVLLDAEEVAALGATDPFERIAAARAMVGELLDYSPGSSASTDGLPEVLATGRGVCRDFAHLLAGLLRATDLPARIVSVYAPQLVPMDFHAVVEVGIEGRWWVVDATGLAPRSCMLRIATGSDAADTAFLANDGSALALRGLSVRATVGRDGPAGVEAEHPGDLVALG